jgi:hypothetical protein
VALDAMNLHGSFTNRKWSGFKDSECSSRNHMTGTIPTEVFSEQPSDSSAQSNQLHGNIPTEMAATKLRIPGGGTCTLV